MERLQQEVESLFAEAEAPDDSVERVVGRLLDGLEDGTIRSATPMEDSAWRVEEWVKKGILLGFRLRESRDYADGTLRFRDRASMPLWDPTKTRRDVRVVPGGSAVRRGAFLADGVVMMPPAYVNVGAYVGSGTMIDSHALVGSCAQVGARVHLSAAVQIGGVLEPIGASPVIIEDDAFIGGGCGVYEGCRVGHGAVLAPGVILSASTPVIDLVHGLTLRGAVDRPLRVPPRAVVVPGSRPATGDYAVEHGVQLQTPVIVKYRDDGTNAALVLEEALR
ncbi:MAG: 2,3,4,5-tetrahydropyridine-2,6-dicarboxylate N-succinyltransferase [Acidobacteriota bacterium]|nr:2,3,4,5-tetrahydropyridine-2,6-dicarboxylate N-succinyltransferase [Acidobacteriota bacterium]MDH3785080.1 2,3,4,5-tetrahydropyridine-2,6-dicarboxylate N-succinyltransferase [Acidobacteriota bacterium]